MPAFVETLILVAALFGVAAIGLFTFFKNPKSATHQLFLVFSTTLFVYIISNFFSLRQPNSELTYFWIRGIMALVPVLNLLYLLLVLAFPKQQLAIRPILLVPLLIVTTILVPLSLSRLIFSGIEIIKGNISPVPGPAMPAFFLHSVFVLGYAFFVLRKKFVAAKGILRSQLGFFLLGTIIFYVSTFVLNYVFILLFSSSFFIRFLPVYSFAFVGCIGYAIVRHKFLDINALVARAVTYVLLITVVAFTFSVLFYLPGRVLLGLYFTTREEIAIVSFTVFIAMSYQLLRRGLEELTQRIFYRDRYDSTKLLYDLAVIMASTLRLEDVTHEVLRKLTEEMNITKAAFILFHDHAITDVRSEGFEPAPLLDEGDMKVLGDTRDSLVFDDLDEGQVKDILRRLDFMVVVHLRTEGKQVGVLVLGQKKSGDMYSEKDINLLNILAPEAAVAIQNALAYEEIRRFSITLQEEVDRATDDLQKANTRLLELDTLKDEFVSLASHELRTPLTSIRSYLWMAMSGKGGEINEKQKYYLDRAFLSADRLIRLVNDMLNISRIESGRLAMQFSRAELSRITKEVLSEVQPKIDEQGLKLHVDIIQHELPDVIADIDKVKEVFINFIGNAIKFTPRGGSITISSVRKEDYICVSVTDTGLGFGNEDIEKLFHKFSTLSATAQAQANQFQSTGLGLYISKAIIMMHGGEVTAVSLGHNKGATFTFTLPIYTPRKREELQRKYVTDGLGIIHSSLEVQKTL